MMERRRAHLHARGERFNTQRQREVLLQPIDGLGDAVALAVDRGNLPEPASLIAGQQSVVDFTLDQRGERRDGVRLVQQREQARERGKDGGRCRAEPRAHTDRPSGRVAAAGLLAR